MTDGVARSPRKPDFQRTAKIMRSAYDQGGSRLMSIWLEDIQAVEEALAKLASPPPAAPVAMWEALKFVKGHLEAMDRLKGWRFEEMRERVNGVLSAPQPDPQTVGGDDLVEAKAAIARGEYSELPPLGDSRRHVHGMQPSLTVPNGWKLVPIEPTQDMLDMVTSSEGYEPWTDKIMRETYQEMVNAAPAPPAAPFYGATCPTYPNCTGGCGLGCRHEIETPTSTELIKAEITVSADAVLRLREMEQRFPFPGMKLVYVKRWRTIVQLPEARADEIVEALRPQSSEDTASDYSQHNAEIVRLRRTLELIHGLQDRSFVPDTELLGAAISYARDALAPLSGGLGAGVKVP